MKKSAKVLIGILAVCLCCASPCLWGFWQSKTILVVFEGADRVTMNGVRVDGDSAISFGYDAKRFEASWGKTTRRFILRPRWTDDDSASVSVKENEKHVLHGGLDFVEVP